jgi:hypothetical protein
MRAISCNGAWMHWHRKAIIGGGKPLFTLRRAALAE